VKMEFKKFLYTGLNNNRQKQGPIKENIYYLPHFLHL
jgi:hypothetical protein